VLILSLCGQDAVVSCHSDSAPESFVGKAGSSPGSPIEFPDGGSCGSLLSVPQKHLRDERPDIVGSDCQLPLNLAVDFSSLARAAGETTLTKPLEETFAYPHIRVAQSKDSG